MVQEIYREVSVGVLRGIPSSWKVWTLAHLVESILAFSDLNDKNGKWKERKLKMYMKRTYKRRQIKGESSTKVP